MGKNLFQNACFGKAYKTRDGRKAVFLQTYKIDYLRHELAVEDKEEELDGMAWSKAREEYIGDYREPYAKGFKAGYRKAMEE